MLLRQNRTPFIVAVNKIDREYGWVSHPDLSIVDALKAQPTGIRNIIETRIGEINAELAAEEYNTALYYRNKDYKSWVSVVPVSAKSGDGLADLLALIMQLTQKLMIKQLTVQHTLRCVVMEVKKTAGYGTTLDVILVDGTLVSGQTIVVCGSTKLIITTIRALLVPHSLQELRVKGEYSSVQRVQAAQCLKIAASGLDAAVAGTNLRIVTDSECIKQAQQELEELNAYPLDTDGVYVKASTLGSLQALYSHLRENDIQISALEIGEITRKDLTKAGAILERSPKHGCILAFDLTFTDTSLQEYAKKLGLRVFTNDVMYQLVEDYQLFLRPILDAELRALQQHVVYPCKLSLRTNWIFRAAKPMILGCRVETGQVRIGTPLVTDTLLQLGTVCGIKVNNNERQRASAGTECSLRIEGKNIVAGRHFLKRNSEIVYSDLTRESIDALKKVEKDNLVQDELRLIVYLKKMLKIEFAERFGYFSRAEARRPKYKIEK